MPIWKTGHRHPRQLKNVNPQKTLVADSALVSHIQRITSVCGSIDRRNRAVNNNGGCGALSVQPWHLAKRNWKALRQTKNKNELIS